MNTKAAYYINKLGLEKHPEGGYYREIYRAGEMFFSETNQVKKLNKKNISTSIYFLLNQRDKSSFHRLKSDEIWHHYDGCDVKIFMINPDGKLDEFTIGKKSKVFQLVIPAGNWFAAELIDKTSFALVGCTVSPGFDFSDFELGNRDKLIKNFPGLEKLIKRFTHPD